MNLRLAALVLALLPALARAQPVPGLDGTDTRRPVNARAAPWNAIGRFEAAGEAGCSGVLVGPRLVLTAAHCLVDEARGRMLPASAARFTLADGTVRQGVSYRHGQGFIPARQEPWRADWAYVTLDAEVPGVQPLALLREPPSAGLPLALGGWQHDRPGVITADTGCRVIGTATYGAQGMVIQHNCAGTFGSSGAPILARGADGRWAILGVQAKAALGQRFGVAVPAFALPLP